MFPTRISIVAFLITLFILITAGPALAVTCDCLREEPPPRLVLARPYVRGEAVAYLQARLLEQGFDPGPVDGVYGPLTHRAVLAFARSHHINLKPGSNSRLWQELSADTVAASHPVPKPPKNPYITIDVATLKLTLYSNGKPYREYPVACGTSETPTPIGEWTIIHKDMNWGDGFGSRWMGLNVPWGIFGIHGTNKPWTIGTYASHGCIRMYNEDVEELFPLVPIGTPVKILDSAGTAPLEVSGRPLKAGSIGQDVVYVQEKLKQKGLYWGYADGRFEEMSIVAVKYLQYLYGRPPTGEVDKEMYRILGFSDIKEDLPTMTKPRAVTAGVR